MGSWFEVRIAAVYSHLNGEEWLLVRVKHMAFHVGGQIDVGVEIVPMKAMQAEMSSGPGYYEGALFDIARQGRGVPAVPLVLIGVVP